MPIENERKFVILESPETEQIIFDQSEQTLRIEQKYLIIDKGISVRIRQTINDGMHSYRLTVKQNVAGQVVEIETPISEDDFRKLWTTGINKITKTRYIYQGWEIDFFKNEGINYLAIAEIELTPWQKEPESIPKLIQNYLIFAVPIEDNRFSNKKLGNIKYAIDLLNSVKKEINLPKPVYLDKQNKKKIR